MVKIKEPFFQRREIDLIADEHNIGIDEKIVTGRPRKATVGTLFKHFGTIHQGNLEVTVCNIGNKGRYSVTLNSD